MIKKDLIIELGQYLNLHDLEYAFLHDRDKKSFRDIDILIDYEKHVKCLRLILEFCVFNKLKVINFVQNCYSLQLYTFNCELGIVQFDLMLNISFRGVEYISSKELLENYSDLFCEVKYVNKKAYLYYILLRAIFFSAYIDISLNQKNEIKRDIDEGRAPGFAKKYEKLIIKYLQGVKIKRIFIYLLVDRLGSSFKRTVGGVMANIYYKICRKSNYSGVFLVFLGPDGAGKTTVIKQLPKLSIFKKYSNFYLLPAYMKRYKSESNIGTVNTVPHSRPPRGMIFSMIKQLFWIYEYNIGYFSIIRPCLEADQLVAFDRYYSDIVVDPIRYRYSGPSWFVKLIDKIIVKPDLVFLISAECDTIQKRKSEVSVDETKRQLAAYKSYVKSLENGFIVSTENHIDDVNEHVKEIIVDFMSQRAHRRIMEFFKGNRGD